MNELNFDGVPTKLVRLPMLYLTLSSRMLLFGNIELIFLAELICTHDIQLFSPLIITPIHF